MGIYGTLKLSGEHIVKAYSSVFDLPYTIIRPSALYGERCVSRRVGQIFIENAIQDLDININGSGDEKLDFTYIDDLVQGIYKSCINENSKNQTFNITFGNSRKLSELADLVKSEFPKVKINYVGKEQFMPERGTLNIDKAKKLIVGAHYDVAGDQDGADDNASAVAGLLETARMVFEAKPDIDSLKMS